MIKINSVLVCIYLSCYIQYYEAQSNTEPLQQCDQHQVLAAEQELDDLFDETVDFLHPISLHKKVSVKKTRYGQLQDKYRDYGMMFLIYYLHVKEQWHAFYAQFKKKLHKIVSYLMYC